MDKQLTKKTIGLLILIISLIGISTFLLLNNTKILESKDRVVINNENMTTESSISSIKSNVEDNVETTIKNTTMIQSKSREKLDKEAMYEHIRKTGEGEPLTHSRFKNQRLKGLTDDQIQEVLKLHKSVWIDDTLNHKTDIPQTSDEEEVSNLAESFFSMIYEWEEEDFYTHFERLHSFFNEKGLKQLNDYVYKTNPFGYAHIKLWHYDSYIIRPKYENRTDYNYEDNYPHFPNYPNSIQLFVFGLGEIKNYQGLPLDSQYPGQYYVRFVKDSNGKWLIDGYRNLSRY